MLVGRRAAGQRHMLTAIGSAAGDAGRARFHGTTTSLGLYDPSNVLCPFWVPWSKYFRSWHYSDFKRQLHRVCLPIESGPRIPKLRGPSCAMTGQATERRIGCGARSSYSLGMTVWPRMSTASGRSTQMTSSGIGRSLERKSWPSASSRRQVAGSQIRSKMRSSGIDENERLVHSFLFHRKGQSRVGALRTHYPGCKI